MSWARSRGTSPANGSVKPDAGVPAPPNGQLNGIIRPSPRPVIVRSDAIISDVAAGSPVPSSRTMAKQQSSADPLLHELEQLIDRAWAEYAVAETGASAAQTSSSTVGSDVRQPVARPTVTATRDQARQEAVGIVHSNQRASTVAHEVVRDGLSDRQADAILRRMEAMLDPFKAAAPRPPVQSPNTPKPSPTR